MAAPDVIKVALFFFFSIPLSATSVKVCPTTSCNISPGPRVRFPFQLVFHNQTDRCSYPGFDLSCNSKDQIILNLPSSGDFIVQDIDYFSHTISINDPENCPANRLLQNFSLSGSPFFLPYTTRNYTFFNCSPDTVVPQDFRISCLGGKNYSVAAIPSTIAHNFKDILSSCLEFSEVAVPMKEYNSFQLPYDIQLTWRDPYCGSCEAQGGVCGFKSDNGLDIGCSILDLNPGLSQSTKYGLIIGIGVPGLLCILLIVRVNGCTTSDGPGTSPNTELPTTGQPAITLMGLDGTTIESYPKTVLDEKRQQLKPNDSCCSVCLAEYMPKETLRSIPECNHYFHAQCIDEWLRRNATCPLCRSLPEGPSLIGRGPS